MKRVLMILVGAFCIGMFASPALQAQDNDTLRDRILDRVRQKLEEERKRTIETVDRILEEAMADRGGDAPAGDVDVEELLKELESLRSKLNKTIDDTRKMIGAESEGNDSETTPSKPDTPEPKRNYSQQELSQMFNQAMELLTGGQQDKAIEVFKKIADADPKSSSGYTAMYNIACGYSLMGNTDDGFEWLEKSVKHGFSQADHMEEDPDLENLRKADEKRWKRLVKLARSFRS